MPAVMIATLGTEPQVVTLALTELARGDNPSAVRQHNSITEVIVVHTAGQDPDIQAAIETLDDAFATDQRLSTYQYRRVLLRSTDGPLTDVASRDDVMVVSQTLNRLVRDYKEQGYTIHLNIAGGRKPMAVYGMLAAQLWFEEADHVWYLISTGSLLDERRLFPEPGDEFALVPIPVPAWSETSPILTDLFHYDDLEEAVRQQRRQKRQQAMQRRREFLRHWLTPAERELVEELVRQGGTDAELAQRLNKESKTVSNQLYAVYRKLHEFLGFRDDVTVNRYRLIAEFSPYFELQDRGV